MRICSDIDGADAVIAGVGVGGGPAYPLTVTLNGATQVWPGMTLRDYFAAKAMVSLTGHSNEEIRFASDAAHAKWAYEKADAMLEARK